VGGTKIAAGLAHRDGRIIACQRAPTAQAGGAQVVSQIIALVGDVLQQAIASPGELAAIGVALPAVIDQARGMVLWAPNIPGWQQETLVAQPISQAMRVPVSLHYDGHAWVAGEWWCGAARGAADVALLAVGTGIGGGLILGNRLYRGRVGVAGAVGWWVADRPQACGRTASEGWLESLASGPAIARAAGQGTAEEAFAAARAGDARAQQAAAQAAQVLGAAAANLVSLVDPEVVVFAGGVMVGGADLLFPGISDVVRREAQPQIARQVRLVTAELGEDAAWLGAARLALLQMEGEEAGV